MQFLHTVFEAGFVYARGNEIVGEGIAGETSTVFFEDTAAVLEGVICWSGMSKYGEKLIICSV